VFIAQGYERAQMEDVASVLGVAKGTLYGYVESKAALFDLALRCADGLEPLPEVASLPCRTPSPEATVNVVRTRLAAETAQLEFHLALERMEHPEPAVELAAVVRDLYRRMSRNRHGIKLVDRCAPDRPELADMWFGEGRWAELAAFARYLELRVAKGLLRALPDTEIAARGILEAIAFWAVHRHWDPSPRPVDEEDVEATLLSLTLFGLVNDDR